MTFREHFAYMWWAYLVIFMMICLSAYFSASEIAFNTSNKLGAEYWIAAMEFMAKLEQLGVRTVICTDISRDGAMAGTNHDLYRQLSEKYALQIIASGGVSSLEDVRRLAKRNLYGAIIGKAYYTGAISLKEAIEVAE